MKTTVDDLEIERFLDARMTPEERAAFERRLHDDARLRETLRAERAIRDAMSRGRDLIRPDHAALRAQVMGTLASTAPIAQTGGGLLAGAWGASAMKAIVAVIAVGTLTVGTMLLWPTGEEPAAPTRSGSPHSETSHSEPSRPGPSRSEPLRSAVPIETPAHSEQTNSEHTNAERTNDAAPPDARLARVPGSGRVQAPSASSFGARNTAARNTAARNAGTTKRHPSGGHAIETAAPPARVTATEENRPHPVFRSDTLRTRVRVEVEPR